MIDLRMVDAGVIVWAMVNGAICTCIIGGIVWLVRRHRAKRIEEVQDMIARYEKRMGKRGAVNALWSRV